eukprot:1994348-Alexandrium_andersonii.AAC.1
MGVMNGTLRYLPALSPSNKLSKLELPNMRHCFRSSELELYGPRSGLNSSTLQGLVRGTTKQAGVCTGGASG